MNRKARRAAHVQSRQHASGLPATLTPIPKEAWPPTERIPEQVWLSRRYLVQLYAESNPHFPGMGRLSICRVTRSKKETARWEDNISWDELQAVKAEVGFGDWYAVEVYPRERNLINVSNMRHLWLFPVPLPVGWFGERAET